MLDGGYGREVQNSTDTVVLIALRPVGGATLAFYLVSTSFLKANR